MACYPYRTSRLDDSVEFDVGAALQAGAGAVWISDQPSPPILAAPAADASRLHVAATLAAAITC